MSTQSAGLFLAANDSIHGLAGSAASITYTIFGKGPRLSKILAQGQLGTSDALLYSPATEGGDQALVLAVVLANVTSGSISGVKLGINGSAATAAYQILSSASIPANGCAIFDGTSWSVYDSGGNLQLAGAGNTSFDSTIASVTTPLALGTAGSAATAAHRDHSHQSPGGIASIVAESTSIVNSEALVVGAAIPANLMQAGTTFRITASGTITTTSAPGSCVFRARIGTTTLTGNIAATVTAPANVSLTTQPFWLDFLVTVRTAGAGGTVVGQALALSANASTGAFTSTVIIGTLATAVAVDTTAAKRIELTAITGAATAGLLFENASISVVQM